MNDNDGWTNVSSSTNDFPLVQWRVPGQIVQGVILGLHKMGSKFGPMWVAEFRNTDPDNNDDAPDGGDVDRFGVILTAALMRPITADLIGHEVRIRFDERRLTEDGSRRYNVFTVDARPAAGYKQDPLVGLEDLDLIKRLAAKRAAFQQDPLVELPDPEQEIPY